MKIKDVEQKVGLNRNTIFFYEKEGMIQPQREGNGYREYTEDDIKKLELIKFLRSMDIPIDDVKGILSGTINFQEYLNETHAQQEQELQRREKIQHARLAFEEKNLPLIPELEDAIHQKKDEGILGYHKTTEKVQLGRRLTRAFAIRQLIIFTILSAVLTTLTFHWMNPHHTFGIIIVLLTFPVYLLMCMAFSVKISSYGSQTNNNNQSIEFNDTYIEFYKNEDGDENIRFFLATLCNRNQSFFKRYAYEEIASVDVLTKLRYLNIHSNIGIDAWTLDFDFHFKDGTDFYFYWPDILEGDGKYIATILLEKVKNINDPNHVLQAMREGKSVHQYMTDIQQ